MFEDAVLADGLGKYILISGPFTNLLVKYVRMADNILYNRVYASYWVRKLERIYLYT